MAWVPPSDTSRSSHDGAGKHGTRVYAEKTGCTCQRCRTMWANFNARKRKKAAALEKKLQASRSTREAKNLELRLRRADERLERGEMPTEGDFKLAVHRTWALEDIRLPRLCGLRIGKFAGLADQMRARMAVDA